MNRRIKRPWLRYASGNLLAATVVGLPLGAALVFMNDALGLPLWPAVLLTPLVVVFHARLRLRTTPTRRARRWIRLGLGAAMGVAITLLEAPWREVYDEWAFWTHAQGLALGGAIAGVAFCVACWAALALEKQGPFENLIPSGPLIMTLVAVVAGGFSGFIISGFTLPLWTTGMADLRPGFVPVAAWITLVTAVVFAPLGLLMGFFTDVAQGEIESGSGSPLPPGGSSIDVPSWGGGSSSSRADDEE